jgi:hypothetical protein
MTNETEEVKKDASTAKPTAHDKRDQAQKRITPLEVVALFIAAAGVGASILQWHTYVLQWHVMQDQLNDARKAAAESAKTTAETLRQFTRSADAADSAAKSAGAGIEETRKSNAHLRDAVDELRRGIGIGAKQLEASDRPWVLVDVSIREPLRFSRDGVAMMSFDYFLVNSGRSVATDVQLRARLIPESLGTTTRPFPVLDEQLDLCDRNSTPHEAKPQAVPLGHTLFPGGRDQGQLSTSMGKEQMERAIIQFSGTADHYIAPALVGCVVYRFPNATKDHKTRFAYTISRNEPGADPLHDLAIQIGKDLPMDKLIFRQYFFGGAHAD